MIIVLSLLIIGILANYSGLIAEKLKLPSLIGMMIVGMLIGPSYLNLVPQGTLEISSTIKDVALVTVLFIGGLGISLDQIKQIGRPAVLLSVVPATLEGFVIAFLSMKFLGFTFIQGAILGFIIAAVSPAVLIPSMISLIDRKVDKIIYKKFSKDYRIYPNSFTCNCFKLPDETIVMATDIGFHLSALSSMLINDTKNG